MIAQWQRLALPIMVALLVTACNESGSDQTSSTSAHPSTAPVVYADISASDGVGAGAADPLRDAWPQVFFRTALPRSAVLYNLSEPRLTVAEALAVEGPEALSVGPTLVTVWLNVDDLIARVPTSDYEAELDQLVHNLRRGGLAKVLVANTPYLDRLPAYLACRAGTPPAGIMCPAGLADVQPAGINALVDGYNLAIGRVVQKEGAVLVDLHAGGETPDLHPTWVSSDGFHPSTEGYAAIAASFAAAWRKATNAAA
jgi:acyl-CoA thioesterase I